jgi:hypothetical protein
VDVRARRTGVRLRALFAVTRTFFVAAVVAFGDLEGAFFTAGFFDAGFLAVALLAFGLLARPFAVRFAAASVTVAREDLLAAFLRVVERTAPVVFLRDAAAFNCFPLFGLWSRPSSRTPRRLPGSALLLRILAERLTANPTLFIGPIQNCGQTDTMRPK